jgi:hypothetical protein
MRLDGNSRRRTNASASTVMRIYLRLAIDDWRSAVAYRLWWDKLLNFDLIPKRPIVTSEIKINNHQSSIKPPPPSSRAAPFHFPSA